MPVGLGMGESVTRITRVGVQMISTATSCLVTLSRGMSSTSCSSCTLVTTTVVSSMAPMYRSMPYSSSANPSPLPSRAPVLGSTATEPTTTMSTFMSASSVSGLPYSATPAEVLHLRRMAWSVISSPSSSEKKPVRRRGWGVISSLPSDSTAIRTPFCGVSGLTLMHLPCLNSGRAASCAAASAAVTKFGMRWCTGLGFAARFLVSNMSQMRFRIGHFHALGPSGVSGVASAWAITDFILLMASESFFNRSLS
mmetsp:Transcript_13441/g.28574  ORF Transcript_13441/g.28574 Transcript_13441/m.28574 type:complete len:253 (-) Transcript_13441:335-1093(-)